MRSSGGVANGPVPEQGRGRRATWAGATSLGRGLLLASVTGLALVLSLGFVPRLSVALVPRSVLALNMKAVWPSRPLLAQFVAYVLYLVIAAVAGICGSLLVRAAQRRPLFVRAVTGALVSALAVAAMAKGAVIAVLAGLWLPVATMILASGSRRIRAVAVGRDREPLAVPILAGAYLCAMWACWLVTFAGLDGAFVRAALVLTVLAGWRVRDCVLAAVPQDELRLEALSWTPLFLLPVLGLLRSPSPWWLAAAAAAAVASRYAVSRQAWPRARLVRLSALVALPFGLISIMAVPVQFRELANENHLRHEAQHYGWIASALNGKLLMADAGTFYGPIREYLLTLWVWLAGTTLDQVRVAAVLCNLLGIALLLVVGKQLVGGRLWAQAWFAFLLLVVSPLRFLMAYWNEISFGWVDVLRIAANVATLHWTLVQLTTSEVASRRMFRSALIGGALSAFALLYSQEFGICSLIAVSVAVTVHCLIRRDPTSLRRALAGRLGGYWLGVALAGALWLFVYALFGKAGLFLRTAWYTIALTGSGAVGGSEYPASAEWLMGLTFPLTGESTALFEYYLAPLVYILVLVILVARWIWRRWTSQSSVLVGLLVFGSLAYRIVANRADVYHLTLATLPACLLAATLVAELSSFSLQLGRRSALRLGGATAVVVILASVSLHGVQTALVPRLATIGRGAERANTATPFSYPDVPRAGDMRISEDTVLASKYILAHTSATDSIFCRVEFMDGMELYFLTGRRNPTRFDMLAEVVWTPYQEEIRRDLERNPPTLVIGTFRPFLGDALADYLDTNWKPVAQFGRYTISRRPAEAGTLGAN